jgi:hypothetical protein
MRTTTAKRLAQAVARRLGRMPDATDGMATAELQSHLSFAEDALRTVWEWARWPDLMRRQPRRLETEADSGALLFYHEAGAWSDATTYEAGDYARSGGRVWKALAQSLDVEPAAGDYWEVDRDWRPAGTVFEVRESVGGKPMPFSHGTGATYVAGSGATEGAIVWVTFRLPVPYLTSEAYDADTTYDLGDHVYYAASATSEGRVFQSLQGDNEGKTPGTSGSSLWWSEIEVPAYFARATAALAAADAFYSDEREGEGERLERKGLEAVALLRASVLGANAGLADYTAVE